MRPTVLIRSWSVSWWRNERGIVLALALVVMTLLMGVGSAALFSGYTNLQTSTNLRLGSRARATAEAAINEALYRLSRQEGKPGAIAPDLTTANWQMQILSHGTANSPTQVATIQATGDWPHAASTPPVVVRYKKDASGSVIFYDRTRNPSLFPIALPAASIPDTAHPVLQILAFVGLVQSWGGMRGSVLLALDKASTLFRLQFLGSTMSVAAASHGSDARFAVAHRRAASIFENRIASRTMLTAALKAMSV